MVRSEHMAESTKERAQCGTSDPPASPAFGESKRPTRYRRSRMEFRMPVVVSMTLNESCAFPNPTGFLMHCSDN
ncbi:hypothetical protein ACVISU_007226 [Bradyrhizobium sp. USDA 4452]